MILTYLSLQRAPRLHRQMPRAPTNEQRIREFRRVYPQAVGNTFRWPFHGSQSGATSPGPSNPAGCHLYEAYAREQCADGAPDVITHYADRRGV